MSIINKNVINILKFPICLKCKTSILLQKTFINLAHELIIKYSCLCSHHKLIPAKSYISELLFHYKICRKVCISCSSNKGYYYCNNCQNYYCNKCTKKKHNGHIILHTQIKNFIQNCINHQTRACIYYCIDCSQKICELCFQESHNKHKCLSSSNYVKLIERKWINKSTIILQSLKKKLICIPIEKRNKIAHCYHNLLLMFIDCFQCSFSKKNLNFLMSFDTLLSNIPNYEYIAPIKNNFLLQQIESHIFLGNSKKEVYQIIPLNPEMVLIILRDDKQSEIQIYNYAFSSLIYSKSYRYKVQFIIKMEKLNFLVICFQKVVISELYQWLGCIYNGEIINCENFESIEVMKSEILEEIYYAVYLSKKNTFLFSSLYHLIYFDADSNQILSLTNMNKGLHLYYFNELHSTLMSGYNAIFIFNVEKKKLQEFLKIKDDINYKFEIQNILYQKSSNELIIYGIRNFSSSDENFYGYKTGESFIKICNYTKPTICKIIKIYHKFSRVTQIQEDYLIGNENNFFIVFGLKEERIVQYYQINYPLLKDDIILKIYDTFFVCYNRNRISFIKYIK